MADMEMQNDQCRGQISWKDELLRGVERLNGGERYGSLVVHEDELHQAEAIVSAENGEVVIAAGQIGNGRVAVVANDHILKIKEFRDPSKCDDAELKKFHLNLKSWVTHGKYDGTPTQMYIVNLKNMEKRSGYHILVYHGDHISHSLVDKVYDFVHNGGGLILAFNPGNWLNKHKHKEINDIPFAGLLDVIGIHFTNTIFSSTDGLYIGNDNYCIQTGQVMSHSEPEEWENYVNVAVQWQREILENVKSLPRKGHPGLSIAYGKKAAPILGIHASQQNVIMSAAELQKGRIFSITQAGYLNMDENKNCAQLLSNVYKWLTRGTYESEDDIVYLKSVKNFQKAIPGKKIIIWSGQDINEQMTQKIYEFILKGGGLIHAVAPWGWLQQHKGKSLGDIPLSGILAASGLAYSKNICEAATNYTVDLEETASVEFARQNIGYLLKYITSMELLEKYGQNIVIGLSKISKDTMTEITDDVLNFYKRFESAMKYPSGKTPLKNPGHRALTMVCDLLCNSGNCGMDCIPCVDIFPGSCNFENVDPKLICVDKEFAGDRPNFHSAGVFVMPGVPVKIIVQNPLEALEASWNIRIGSHTDNLDKKPEWKRWPHIIKRTPLKQEIHSIKSPYGGLLYFENPNSPKLQVLKVKVENVIQAPRFNLSSPDCKTIWQETKDSPAPWADISGRRITFTLPTNSVKNMEFQELAEVMETWDKVVEAHYSLQSSPPSTHRHQWVVTDEQPSAGYMHSGYPIVTHMDVSRPKKESFLLNHKTLTQEGFWGMFHELGHNMQKSMWNFVGTGEVTCNIFTLHAMDLIAGQKPWIHPWLKKASLKIKSALMSKNPYETWKSSPAVALTVYAQLQHSFGWESYKQVFTHYESLDQKKLPKGDQEKLDYWITIFSQTVKYNLCPLFELWGLPFGDEVRKKLHDLPTFLPDDEVSSLAPARAKYIVEKYPGIMRKIE